MAVSRILHPPTAASRSVSLAGSWKPHCEAFAFPSCKDSELCVTVSVAGYVQPALFEYELSWCRRLNRATPHTIKSGVNLRHSFVTNYRSAACSNVLEILRACKANHHGRDTGYHQEAVKAMSPSVTIVSAGQKPDTDASAKYTNGQTDVAKRDPQIKKRRRCSTADRPIADGRRWQNSHCG